MTERYKRQSFLGKESEARFAATHAGVIGLGGGGSHLGQQLAHIGIGNISVVDDDIVEDSNLNRLVGATEIDVAKKTLKTAVAEKLINGVNPLANVFCIEKKWQLAMETLQLSDIIFGCVDSYSERDQLERFCRRNLIPYIDIGMDVHAGDDAFFIGGQVFLSMPGQHCMQCCGILTERKLAEEAARYGAAGDRPQVIWPNSVLASLAIGIFVQLFTPWHRSHRDAIYLEYDGNRQTVTESRRLEAVRKRPCPHFPAPEVGDVFRSS